jgi:exopolysaccharide production protein ExoY
MMVAHAEQWIQHTEVARRRTRRNYSARIKRALDVALSAGALLFLSPGLLLIATILFAIDGGPVIYRHNRVGRNGRMFGCLKFRSMYRDADRRLKEILESDPARRKEWAESQKLSDDPRVHRLGRLLRRSSLDELPQLFNVLRGEMSIVGPRPIVTDELPRYGEHAGYYLAVTPGITGLWQVSGRNGTGYEERVLLDVEYCRTRSTRLDLIIMLKTVRVVLWSPNGM